jgi:hypothetical protein
MSYGADFQYDDKTETLRVPGILFVTDGWTRCNAALRATNENPELELYQSLKITNFAPDDAAYMAYQYNMPRKFKTGTTSIKSQDSAPMLVKEIIKRKSIWNEGIGYKKQDGKMFLFDDFVQVIEALYTKQELDNNMSRLTIAKTIIDGITTLIFDNTLALDKVYSGDQLAYYLACIKVSGKNIIDLVEIIANNPIETVLSMIKSKSLRIKTRKIEEIVQ